MLEIYWANATLRMQREADAMAAQYEAAVPGLSGAREAGEAESALIDARSAQVLLVLESQLPHKILTERFDR